MVPRLMKEKPGSIESTSAVTGPMMTGPRGVDSVLVIDLVGSMTSVGSETPDATRPDELIVAAPSVEAVPGPSLRKPPSILPPMITAEPASGLPPRWFGVDVPISEMLPALTKAPPEDVGQLKPEGAPVSLAQEWMPPRVWMPVMPAPTPEMAELI